MQSFISALSSTSHMVSSVSAPHSVGMLLVRRFCERSRFTNCVSSPISEGTGPYRHASSMSMFVIAAIAPSSVGTVPLRHWSSAIRSSTSVSRPSSVGSWPVRLLAPRSKLVSAVRSPISVGIVQLSDSEARLRSVHEAGAATHVVYAELVSMVLVHAGLGVGPPGQGPPMAVLSRF